MKSLNEIGTRAYQHAQNMGQHNEEVPYGTYISNVHEELSELQRCYREGSLDEPSEKIPEITNEAEELSDLIIYAANMAAQKGIDLDRAVELKQEYNETRSKGHGGRKV